MKVQSLLKSQKAFSDSTWKYSGQRNKDMFVITAGSGALQTNFSFGSSRKIISKNH